MLDFNLRLRLESTIDSAGNLTPATMAPRES